MIAIGLKKAAIDSEQKVETTERRAHLQALQALRLIDLILASSVEYDIYPSYEGQHPSPYYILDPAKYEAPDPDSKAEVLRWECANWRNSRNLVSGVSLMESWDGVVPVVGLEGDTSEWLANVISKSGASTAHDRHPTRKALSIIVGLAAWRSFQSWVRVLARLSSCLRD